MKILGRMTSKDWGLARTLAPQRWVVASAVVLLAAAAAAAAANDVLAGDGHLSSNSTPAVATTQPRCPAKAPQPLGGRVKAEGHASFLASRARLVLLCRYHGLNGSPKLGLARAQSVRRGTTIHSLTKRINALPLQHAAVFGCPLDDHREVVLTFSYPQRADENVTVDLRGCGEVSNGQVTTYALPSRDGARLLAELRALTSLRR
jgi:hypothetical protein